MTRYRIEVSENVEYEFEVETEDIDEWAGDNLADVLSWMGDRRDDPDLRKVGVDVETVSLQVPDREWQYKEVK